MCFLEGLYQTVRSVHPNLVSLIGGYLCVLDWEKGKNEGRGGRAGQV